MIATMYRIFPLIFLTLVLCGCNLSSAAPVPVATEDSAQPVRLQVAELTPTLSATATVTAAPKATASPAPLDRCAPAAERPIRLIQADVTIDYATKRTEVVQRIEFLNREESALAEIVLDVQANQWPESFWLNDVTVDEAPADYALEANRLQVALHSPLESGCWLEIGLGLTVQPAAIRDGLRAYRGFLGYSTRQLNLAHFLPTVAARLGGAWRIHKPIGIGEQVVHAVADWQVTVTALNAAETLQLAAPGLVNDMGAGKWEISLDNSRDFAISLSEDFVLTEQEITADLTIAVYAFADATINAGGFQLDGAQHAGQEAEKALELFGRQFGAYPRPRFVIVQGDFPDGMEFSGLVFVGSAWFYYFDGSPKNYLTLISVHEIAHQWWYARVGSDAALHPWLDEALATYSEYLFIEEFYPAEKNWW